MQSRKENSSEQTYGESKRTDLEKGMGKVSSTTECAASELTDLLQAVRQNVPIMKK